MCVAENSGRIGTLLWLRTRWLVHAASMRQRWRLHDWHVCGAAKHIRRRCMRWRCFVDGSIDVNATLCYASHVVDGPADGSSSCCGILQTRGLAIDNISESVC